MRETERRSKGDRRRGRKEGWKERRKEGWKEGRNDRGGKKILY